MPMKEVIIRFSAAYWEHMVMHSVREDGKNGFLLPYHDALSYQEENPEFDVADLAVIGPNDKRFEFSYAAEHVSNDSAIRVLLDCVKSLEKAEALGIGENHQASIQWIHNEIAQLEKLRGVYPGMGAALTAFGIEKGHFVAAEIINGLKDDSENPWLKFEEALDKPEGILSKDVAALIPASSAKLYQKLRKAESVRLKFLTLIKSIRFNIRSSQVFIYP